MKRTPHLALFCVAACSRSATTAPVPPTEAAPVVAAATPTVAERVASPAASPGPACAEHRAQLRNELCDPDDQEPCHAEDFPCSVTLDLDGDGEPELVELARSEDRTVLRVQWATGAEELVGAEPVALTEYREPDDHGRTLDGGLSWVVAWSAATREGRDLQHGGRTFDAFVGRGDGLWMSGTDAAAMLVSTDDGWLIVELGY